MKRGYSRLAVTKKVVFWGGWKLSFWAFYSHFWGIFATLFAKNS
jgi:hypothetical protein